MSLMLSFRKSRHMLAAALVLALVVMGGMAQNSRALTPGTPVNGFINADVPLQIYNFAATDAGAVSFALQISEGLALVLAVSDSQGNVIQAATSDGTSLSMDDVQLPGRGIYYVTLAAAPGQDADANGTFTLTLEGDLAPLAATPEAAATEEPASAVPTEDVTAAAPEPTPEAEAETVVFQPGQVLTTDGIRVSLTWNSSADMNLQVRDPIGQTLFFDSTSTPNGGTFGFDVNGLCEVLTRENATETAQWSPGTVPTGSYEILIFYRQDCENTGPTDFTVNVVVDGVALEPITATLNPPTSTGSSVYLASFRVNLDGSAGVTTQGLYTDTRVLPRPVSDFLAEPATPIQTDVVVRDLLTTDDYYDLYSFSASANALYAVSMTAIDGNLDTLLLVLDASGAIVADNDDITLGENTNSRIDNVLIPRDGTYTILATRYGKDVGGSEGNYELVLSQSSINVPQEIAALGLPAGDIEVTLTWNTNADLQLLVRDPAGSSVYDDDTDISSGGRLIAAGNINCTRTQTTPVSYIYWPPGLLRGGSYEIEVWYQNACGDTTPVTFTLYINVDGVVQTYSGTPQPGEVFLTNFLLDQTGNVLYGEGGIAGDSATLDYRNETATPILPAQTLTGSITPQNTFDVYTFTGQAGDSLTATLNRTSGNLDTLLFLVTPDGLELSRNDDASGTTTDSVIANFTLPLAGEYRLLATRYGTRFGGTVGGYNLTLNVEPAFSPESNEDDGGSPAATGTPRG